MDTFLHELANHLVFVIIGACILAGMVLKAFVQVMTTSSRERSRREIAAYVAEGSITPEHGERLLRAEISDGKSCG